MGEIKDFVELYIEDSDILEEATNEIAVSLQQNIKAETPYLQGRLRRAIRVDTRIFKNYSIITGYWDEGLAPHGIFVLAGTDPHDIFVSPKEKKALHWGGEGGPFSKGHTIHHPGTKPNDFLGRGLRKTVEAYR